jgi:hypothetical protein
MISVDKNGRAVETNNGESSSYWQGEAENEGSVEF